MIVKEDGLDRKGSCKVTLRESKDREGIMRKGFIYRKGKLKRERRWYLKRTEEMEAA